MDYVSPGDCMDEPYHCHVYSIDECFFDLTGYLPYYKVSAYELMLRMIRSVLRETGITATAGIGPNPYLAKVCMDIVAKHIPADRDGVRIAELDEQGFREKLWGHEPITDFWRIGPRIANRLAAKRIYTMGDMARATLIDEDWFYREFGVDIGFDSVGMEEANYRGRTYVNHLGKVAPYPVHGSEKLLIYTDSVTSSVGNVPFTKTTTSISATPKCGVSSGRSSLPHLMRWPGFRRTLPSVCPSRFSGGIAGRRPSMPTGFAAIPCVLRAM